MNSIIQLILTYSVIAAALVYIGYHIFRMISPVKENTTGCGAGCGCESAEKKKEILRIKN
jgi:hypothetical protein